MPRLVPTSKSDRVPIIRRLRSVQVLEPEGVSVAWEFKDNWGKVITGQTEKGRVMLAADDAMLKIYLIKEDMKIGCPPLELMEELSKFCGIEKSRHVQLLSHILTQTDIGRMNADLDRWDVPDLGLEFDKVEAEVRQITQEVIPQPASKLLPPDVTSSSLSKRQKLKENWLQSLHGPRLGSEADEAQVDTEDAVPEPLKNSPSTDVPTSALPKRQKLGDGWRQSLYGKKASEQMDLGHDSKDSHTTKSKKNQKDRSGDTTKRDKHANTNTTKHKKNKDPVGDLTSMAPTASRASTHDVGSWYARKDIPSKTSQNSKESAKDETSPLDSLPATHSPPNQNWGQLLGPERFRQPNGRKQGTHGLMSLSMPVISTSRYSQLDESMFIAELYVSFTLS